MNKTEFIERAIQGYIHVNEHYGLALDEFAISAGKSRDQLERTERKQAWLNHLLECSADWWERRKHELAADQEEGK